MYATSLSLSLSLFLSLFFLLFFKGFKFYVAVTPYPCLFVSACQCEGHHWPRWGGVCCCLSSSISTYSVYLPGHRLLSAPSSASSPSSPCSSSSATTAAAEPGVSWMDLWRKTPLHTACPLPCHDDGPPAINSVVVMMILGYFSNQIWIMHLIFLATSLVCVLSPWLHPSLASSGAYCNSSLLF